MTAAEAALRLDDLTDEDLATAHELSTAFGWPHRVADWRMMVRLGKGVAARNTTGQVIGTGVAWTWAARVATVGLILVRSDLQGRGIGGQLFERLLARAGNNPTRLYATPEGRKLYLRHGFVPTARIEQFQGHVTAPPPANEVRRANLSERAGISELDCAAFGQSRDNLLHLLFDAGEAYVFGPEGAPTAFGFRRRFGRGNLIGPVVAPDAEVAVHLMAALVAPGFNRMDLTDAAQPFVPRLKSWGLEPVAVVEEMTAGRWPDRLEATSFALASQSFG